MVMFEFLNCDLCCFFAQTAVLSCELLTMSPLHFPEVSQVPGMSLTRWCYTCQQYHHLWQAALHIQWFLRSRLWSSGEMKWEKIGNNQPVVGVNWCFRSSVHSAQLEQTTIVDMYIWSSSLRIWPSLDNHEWRWIFLRLNQKPSTAKFVDEHIVRRRSEMSLTFSYPKLPITCSKPTRVTPVSALKSPMTISLSCGETEQISDSSEA